ncbi:MAG: Ig-like domain-containing protein [bacterium]|nr:Ig-like domain-containing protein [bacterium]
MSKRIITHALALGVAVASLPSFALAQTASGTDTRVIVLRAFQIIWLLASIGGLGFLIYGFIKLRTAHDDLFAIESAKKMTLIAGIVFVGSVIVSIVLLIIAGQMGKGVSIPPPPLPQPEVRQGLGGEFSGQFSKVKSHYPRRDDKNIARNASLQIEFKTPIQAESIFDATKNLKIASIKIQETATVGKPNPVLIPGKAALDPTRTILTITPSALLGQPDKKISYTVILTAAILKENGESLFGGTGNYNWQFEVSGSIDVTPPFIESMLPILQAGGRAPKNALVQITFNEPIDATTANSGALTVMDIATNKPVSGSFSLGNNFRSLTFTPQETCGKNSCGEAMYCLPKNVSLKVVVKTAGLPEKRNDDVPSKALFPYDGIVDLAGNALDGGGENGTKKNGKSEGSPVDDYSARVATSDEIDTVAPILMSVSPKRNTGSVDQKAPIEMTFSKFMDAASLHTNSVFLSNELNYSVESRHDLVNKRTLVKMEHDPFAPQTLYSPEVRSDVHDAYQNCYQPCAGPLQ